MITMFPVSLFLFGAVCVVAYALWEVCYIYRLTATEAAAVGAATFILVFVRAGAKLSDGITRSSRNPRRAGTGNSFDSQPLKENRCVLTRLTGNSSKK